MASPWAKIQTSNESVSFEEIEAEELVKSQQERYMFDLLSWKSLYGELMKIQTRLYPKLMFVKKRFCLENSKNMQNHSQNKKFQRNVQIARWTVLTATQWLHNYFRISTIANTMCCWKRGKKSSMELRKVMLCLQNT